MDNYYRCNRHAISWSHEDPSTSRSAGKASAEFQKSKIEANRELERLKDRTGVSDIDREKLETIADTLGIDYSNKNDEESETLLIRR